MAYIKTTWKDRLVERPNTFDVVENPDGSITLIPKTGVVTDAGTPVNAANLNKLEDATAAHLAETATDVDGVHGLKIETGTFAPTISGSTTAGSPTYGVRHGSYYKIGNLVHCDVFVKVTDLGGASGSILISLPFTSKTSLNKYASVALGQYDGVLLPDGFSQVMGQVASGTNFVRFTSSSYNNEATMVLNNYYVTSAFGAMLSVSYEI